MRNRDKATEQTVYSKNPVTVKATKIETSPAKKSVSSKRISHTDSQRENDLLMLLLQRELKSPIVSPATVPELLSPDIAQLPLARLTEESESEKSEKMSSITPKSKSNPPRRKRSLIYAMYCTAKSEGSPVIGTAGPLAIEEGRVTDCDNADRPLDTPSPSLAPPVPVNQRWDNGSQFMTTIDNGSTAFVSCTSMPSLRAGYTSIQGQNGLQQTMASLNRMSIKNVLADVAAELSIITSRPASLIDSEDESEYVTGSEVSSRSSFVDAVTVEAAAYRCSGRFAPRLSTIERGKDGRLQIKPNCNFAAESSQASSMADLSPRSRMLASITKAECAGAVDSGNESTADVSPPPETPPVVAAAARSLQRDQVAQIAVEEFPPVPAIDISSKSRCLVAHGHNDSMLINNRRFSTDAGIETRDTPLSASVDNLLAKTTFAGNGNRPRSSTSPPSISPEKSQPITANTSVDTAETAKGDSTPVLLPRQQERNQPDKPEQLDPGTAPFLSLSCILSSKKRPRSPSLPSSSPLTLSSSSLSSSSLSESSLSPAVALSEHGFADGNTGNMVAEPDTGDSQPSRGLRSRHQMSVQRSTGLGCIENDSHQSSNSNLLSIFSDMSETDMLFSGGNRIQQDETAHFKGGQFSQLSLLFDGRPHSVVHDGSLTSAYSDTTSGQFLNNTGLAAVGTAVVDKDTADTGAVDSVPPTFALSNLRIGSKNGDDDDDDDDELALSDIIAINQAVISPPPTQLDAQVTLPLSDRNSGSRWQTETSQQIEAASETVVADGVQSSSIASRTRKLSTALGSIRNLHRKIRSTSSQSRSTSSAKSRGGSVINNSASTGNANANVAANSSSNTSDSQQEQQQQPTAKKTFRFNELVAVYETWNREEYDRKGMPSAKLDAEIIEQIKYELNEFKVYEMQVHEDSRRYTHFIY
ncbi:hypothetical protein GGF40_000359 [Coemansia sp. RSA 1286]|nr:hypothetical protein GGF39_000470 [Coemansia sp. RSA 1721]KAJ2639997.1 hypothetical protein GGF40_000359 [Coemansia sp. RSA 1286]